MESRSVGGSKAMWVSAVVAAWVLASASGCASAPISKEKVKLAGLSDFSLLLVKAGVPIEDVPDDEELDPEEARTLLLKLHATPQTMRTYTFKEVADRMLMYVKSKGLTIKLDKLSEWLQAYDSRAMLRPDGYMAYILTGKEAECVGPVEVKDKTLKAGQFEVGNVYFKGAGGWESKEVILFPRLPRYY